MALDPRLLDLLCCPDETPGQACHGTLEELAEGLRCTRCGLIYPIVEGIPVMLPEQAQR